MAEIVSRLVVKYFRIFHIQCTVDVYTLCTPMYPYVPYVPLCTPMYPYVPLCTLYPDL